MKAKIKILLFVLEEKSFRYHLVSLDSSDLELPSIDIEQYQDIENSLSHLISKYIRDTNSYGIKPKLIDIKVTDQIDVIYYCIIPFHPTIKDSYLLDLEKYEPISNDIRKIWQGLVGKNI